MNDWRRYYAAEIGVTYWPAREGVPIRHLRVWKLSKRDGIPWEVLQRIKDELFGPDIIAIEVYPPAREVINVVNMRHLWEVPEDLVDRIPSIAY
jgi:hypothetical protein